MQLSSEIEKFLRSQEGGWVATPVQCRSCFCRGMVVWPLDHSHPDPWGADALFEGIKPMVCSQCGADDPEHIPIEELSEFEQRTVFNDE